MAATRITVTLPSEQVEQLRKVTENVSGYVADAVARQLRHELRAEELRRHQDSHGAFTDEELAAARSEIERAMTAGSSDAV